MINVLDLKLLEGWSARLLAVAMTAGLLYTPVVQAQERAPAAPGSQLSSVIPITETVVTGRRFVTADNAWLELMLPDGSSLVLAPRTTVVLDVYSYDAGSGRARLLATIPTGLVKAMISRSAGTTPFLFDTLAGSTGVAAGSTALIEVNGGTTATLLAGRQVTLTAKGTTEAIVRPGFQAVASGGPPSAPRRLAADEVAVVTDRLVPRRDGPLVAMVGSLGEAGRPPERQLGSVHVPMGTPPSAPEARTVSADSAIAEATTADIRRTTTESLAREATPPTSQPGPPQQPQPPQPQPPQPQPPQPQPPQPQPPQRLLVADYPHNVPLIPPPNVLTQYHLSPSGRVDKRDRIGIALNGYVVGIGVRQDMRTGQHLPFVVTTLPNTTASTIYTVGGISSRFNLDKDSEGNYINHERIIAEFRLQQSGLGESGINESQVLTYIYVPAFRGKADVQYTRAERGGNVLFDIEPVHIQLERANGTSDPQSRLAAGQRRVHSPDRFASKASTPLDAPIRKVCNGCKYLDWGYVIGTIAQGTTFTDQLPRGLWVAGRRTLDVPGQLLPASGIATYDGGAFGNVFTATNAAGTLKEAIGSFSHTWDFAQRRGSFKLGFDDAHFSGPTRASGNGFQVKDMVAQGRKAAAAGEFYGPAAAETAGTFRIRGAQPSTTSFYAAEGIFAGRKK